MADETRDDAYDPSAAQADRNRMQGLGVGERDLARQDDPSRLGGDEARSFDSEEGVETGDAADDRIQAGPPGKPDKDYDARDADAVSFSQPSGGAGGG
jgi:hypothetical protein